MKRVGEWLSPNMVTGTRFVMSIPVGIFLGWSPIVGAVLYFLAEATDLIDGWLARKSGKVSKIGEWFDVLADHSLALMTISAIGVFFLWQPVLFFGFISEVLLIIYIGGLMLLNRKDIPLLKYRFKWTGKFLLNSLLLASFLLGLDIKILLNSLSLLVSSRNIFLFFELAIRNR